LTNDQILGKGHYYKNQNVKDQKEHQKNCKPSLHQKYSKKDQNIKIDKDQKIEIDKDQDIESKGSLHRKPARQKEHQKSNLSDFCILTKLFYLWCKYLWYFGVNK
jgi:hypothetical protein